TLYIFAASVAGSLSLSISSRVLTSDLKPSIPTSAKLIRTSVVAPIQRPQKALRLQKKSGGANNKASCGFATVRDKATPAHRSRFSLSSISHSSVLRRKKGETFPCVMEIKTG